MPTKSENLNCIPIPHDSDIQELISIIEDKKPEMFAACIALGNKSDIKALNYLIELTKSDDWAIRRIAVEAIAFHPQGKNSAQVLIGLLFDSSHYVSRTACETIGILRITEAHDKIIKLLDSKESYTKIVAIKTLNNIWQEKDYERIFKILVNDPEIKVRKESAFILMNKTNSNNWKPLFEFFVKDTVSRHKVWACNLLEKYGDISYIPILSELEKDKDGHVRKAAQIAINKINRNISD